MSDQTQGKQNALSPHEVKDRILALERQNLRTSALQQDALLQELASMLERLYPTEVGVEVTLSTGGFLISGQLICAQWYFEQLAAQLKASSEPAPALVKLLEPFNKRARTRVQQDEKGEEEFVPNFIHLKNAKFFSPGQKPLPDSGPGVLWRGRISAVDGFTWGAFLTKPKSRF